LGDELNFLGSEKEKILNCGKKKNSSNNNLVVRIPSCKASEMDFCGRPEQSTTDFLHISSHRLHSVQHVTNLEA
jgi:hypothetical protein